MIKGVTPANPPMGSHPPTHGYPGGVMGARVAQDSFKTRPRRPKTILYNPLWFWGFFVSNLFPKMVQNGKKMVSKMVPKASSEREAQK